jgi:hypothetical protein
MQMKQSSVLPEEEEEKEEEEAERCEHMTSSPTRLKFAIPG